MAVFEDERAAEADVLDAAAAVRGCLGGEDAAAVRPGFEYWAGAFGAVRAAPTRDALKGCVRQYLCTPGPHGAPPHNVSQGLMKATVHLIWRKLYQFEAGKWHTDPAEAVRDAVTPPLARGQEYLVAMYTEIAAETGETVEEMMARVCGD